MGRVKLDGGDPWAAWDAAEPKLPREPQPKKEVYDFSDTGRREVEAEQDVAWRRACELHAMEQIMREPAPMVTVVVVKPLAVRSRKKAPRRRPTRTPTKKRTTKKRRKKGKKS